MAPALSGVLFGLTALAAQAQQPRALEPLPDIPAPPKMSTAAGADDEPTVTTRQDREGKIEEFRVGGKVVGVRVTPATGPAYMLVDPDGNGTMTRSDEIGTGLRPAMFTVLEF